MQSQKPWMRCTTYGSTGSSAPVSPRIRRTRTSAATFDGETTAALAHARGAKTHVFEDFGQLTDTYSDTYRDYYGVWRWQDYSEPHGRFASRDGWYARHMAREEILPPLEAALRWTSIQPELQ